MRIKQQHVHSYQQKYLALLQFHKKTDILYSCRYIERHVDTHYTFCCARNLADLALFQRTVALGHISMLLTSLLLVPS